MYPGCGVFRRSTVLGVLQVAEVAVISKKAGGKIRTVLIESWAQLWDELYQDAWNPEISRFRSPYVFRGVETCDRGLQTGLLKLVSGSTKIEKIEGHLLRNFQKYASIERNLGDSCWKWLPVAQHHGLPTRLLDWTFSPLVALHFTVEDPNRYHTDGSLWCFNHQLSNRLLPDKLREAGELEGADVFTARMLQSVAASLHEFDRLAGKPFVLFLEPPSLESRIVNQFALFSIMSSAVLDLTVWLHSHPHLAKQIIIPARLKPEIRDKLDQTGITERLVYPGLDGLARWLSRYYHPGARPGNIPGRSKRNVQSTEESSG
jgi:FRG domain-containing protein